MKSCCLCSLILNFHALQIFVMWHANLIFYLMLCLLDCLSMFIAICYGKINSLQFDETESLVHPIFIYDESKCFPFIIRRCARVDKEVNKDNFENK